MNTYIGDFTEEELEYFNNFIGWKVWKMKDGNFSAKHFSWGEQHRVYGTDAHFLGMQMDIRSFKPQQLFRDVWESVR